MRLSVRIDLEGDWNGIAGEAGRTGSVCSRVYALFCFFPFIFQLKFAPSEMQLLESLNTHSALCATNYLSACNQRKCQSRSLLRTCSAPLTLIMTFKQSLHNLKPGGSQNQTFTTFTDSQKKNMQNLSKPHLTESRFHIHKCQLWGWNQ